MLPRRAQRIVSLAGPAAGFALGAIAYVIALQARPSNPWIVHGLVCAEWASLGWGLVNLLPIVPLDGGQFLRALLPQSARARVHLVGWVAAIPAVALAAKAGWRWAGYLFLWLGITNAIAWWSELRRQPGVREPKVVTVTEEQTRQASASVLAELEQLRTSVREREEQ